MPMKWATRIQGPVAVIGDVHGQTQQLATVLERLQRLPDWQDRWVVFIGDFVDRGPDPCEAIEMALALMSRHPRTTAVMGNHEFAMAAALQWLPTPDYSNWNERWLDHYDSDTTFASYDAQFGNLEELAAKVPARHRDFISTMPWVVEHPQAVFVHAGLDPNQSFGVQLRILQQKDFTLNRPPWLCAKNFVDCDAPPDCPVAVVSGHVQVPQVIMRPKRILCDTTGGYGGDLSCVLLPERKVLTSGEHPEPVSVEGPRQTKSWWKIFA